MARFYRRRKFCRFTAEGITHIDYKDVELLNSISVIMVKSYQAALPVRLLNISVN